MRGWMEQLLQDPLWKSLHVSAAARLFFYVHIYLSNCEMDTIRLIILGVQDAKKRAKDEEVEY